MGIRNRKKVVIKIFLTILIHLISPILSAVIGKGIGKTVTVEIEIPWVVKVEFMISNSKDLGIREVRMGRSRYWSNPVVVFRLGSLT